MGEKYSLPGGPRGEPASPSPIKPEQAGGRRRWPCEVRLLRRAQFEKVYSAGRRYSCPFFSAFVLRVDGASRNIGFTAPRALGKAAQRNRIKRRLREAVRLQLPALDPGWHIVFNPRRVVLQADFSHLEQQVGELFRWLAKRAPGPQER